MRLLLRSAFPVLLALFPVLPGFSQDSGEILVQLPLDDNLDNSLGAGPTMRFGFHPNSGSEPVFEEGHEGKAWIWDGNSTLFTQLANLDYRVQSFTVTCWVKVASLEKPVTLLSVGFPKSMFKVTFEGGAYPGVSAYLGYYAGGRLESVASLNPDVDLFDGAWHQFAVVVDRDRRGEIRFYVDGKLANLPETAYVPDVSWHAGTNSTQDSFFVLGAATPWSLTLPNAKSVEGVHVLMDNVSFQLGVPARYQKSEPLSSAGEGAANAADEAARTAL